MISWVFEKRVPRIVWPHCRTLKPNISRITKKKQKIFQCGVSIDVYQYRIPTPIQFISCRRTFFFILFSANIRQPWFYPIVKLYFLAKITINFFFFCFVSAEIFEYLILINHACLIANNIRAFEIFFVFFFFCVSLFFHGFLLFHIFFAFIVSAIDAKLSMPSIYQYSRTYEQSKTNKKKWRNSNLFVIFSQIISKNELLKRNNNEDMLVRRIYDLTLNWTNLKSKRIPYLNRFLSWLIPIENSWIFIGEF